ncbi:uncharacterized protein LOC114535420 [Dendronephthya gigantea]|uniref:uncharacterized protein LOC114535420 n=1 Tax=Dendronephthya gigantea TaxID=151771 RepID=UPI0010699256|nr:uncharacterized protein LOC114535420 [Dendronephthya gigantea]
MANTTVDDWLRSLGLLNYVQAFIDNGYDDLDICKQIGDEDLDAIGVINAKDRKDILASVQSLKDQGVNAVYFQLEATSVEPTISTRFGGQTDREKYPRNELIIKMKSLLKEDSCVLPEHNPNNDHDPLDDLAQYYADQLYTYFQDVKDVLEFLRDGESNEGPKEELRTPTLPRKKESTLVLQESKGLSKSLGSLDVANVKNKGHKSPKHGISRLFSNKKKSYVAQPPKISGPVETAALFTSNVAMSNVHMSNEDRKSLMLQVKHGDITQDEALRNFLSYEANQTVKEQKEDKANEGKQNKKKKGGLFNRGSFKRRSSGHAQSSEILAADIQLGERDRMELMRKIKNKEITTEEAWDQLRKFGSKRESKTKSPKISRKGSKSPKQRERISASSVQLFSSTFYTGGDQDISQSTSNIPSATGSDSSPDSTPGLQRKELGSSGSIEFDPKNPGNYSRPARPAPAVPPKRSSSGKNAGGDLRRVVSDKRQSKEPPVEGKRRSTLANVESTRSSTSSLNGSSDSLERQSPSPPVKKPPRLLKSKPPISPQLEKKTKTDSLPRRTNGNEQEGKKPVIPVKPALPAKPVLPPKPGRLTPGEKSNSLPKKVPLVSLVNGLACNENINNDAEVQTKAEVTSESNATSQQERSSLPPARPSPETRVSRHKPSGTKLLEMIERKLDDEGIDLVQEPYSNEDGKWGVPMALIDRYSLELQSTMTDVTKEIDHIRIEKLNHVKKKATPCDLSKLRFAPDVVGKLSSLVDWLTSLGLPMYIDNLLDEGYDDMHTIPYLSQEHLQYAKITKPEHINRLIRSIENMAPDTASYNGD